MEGFALSGATASSIANRPLLNLFPSRGRKKSLDVRPRKARVSVLASKDNHPKLDRMDQMELKFGKLLGEDPKLTLAKIMGRKLNPDISYLEIEKAFYSKKGKSLFKDVEAVPFDVPERRKLSSSTNGLNLARPVPKKGIECEEGEKSQAAEIRRPSQSFRKAHNSNKDTMPKVILRKPSNFYVDNSNTQNLSRLRIQPNLSLKMGEELKEKFCDITLLKKPEPRSSNTNLDSNGGSLIVTKPKAVVDADNSSSTRENMTTEAVNAQKRKSVESVNGSTLQNSEMKNIPVLGTEHPEQSGGDATEVKSAGNEAAAINLVDPHINSSIDATIQGKPQRLDQSVRETTNASSTETVCEDTESYIYALESENFLATSTLKEGEDINWKRAEDLAKNEGKEEVEVLSSSTRGFAVSFGSLVGFLPYRNLAAKMKFLAFESWLRRKGLDPSVYKQNLGIIEAYEAANKNPLPGSSVDPDIDLKVEKEFSPDMKLDELLQIYDQEKKKFLSSFVGQKIKVHVILADRKSRKLIFSMRPREKEELVEKKRSLMTKLSIGDVVKCCVKKITYFGIFVEIEGVSALIHQSEVSWDSTLDPASYYKIGQIVDAKVHQLDFSLERIFLSLKEITPDPLIEALECVVGDRDCLDGKLEAAEADAEWADVESLVRELQNIEGIQSVSKGRFFISPGLAPTFQVYMASMFENEYKLLARSGNKVQEVIVQASLEKEEMKSAILACTNRVE